MKNTFFDRLNEAIRNTESSVVNVISAIAPWLAPLAPAYMTYQHAVGTLGFPVWVAFPVAVVVEILGFSAVSTFLAFWFHNRRSAASKKAPINVVVFAFLFYLSLIIFANVLLDTFENDKWAVVAVRALFTLQTIPAALIVAVRTQHRDLLAEIEKERANKKTNKGESFANETPKETNRSRTFASLTNSEKYYLANAESGAAAKEFSVTPRAIQKWKIKITDEIAQGRL
jgi:hypothetical protein